MTDYKATPEQWEHVHICAGMKHQVPWATADCLLELRDRIQLLEDAVHKHIVETSANILALASRVEALESTQQQREPINEEENNRRFYECMDLIRNATLEQISAAAELPKRPASKVYEISEPLKLTPEQAQQITDLLTPNSSAPLTSSNYPAKPDGSLVRRVALAISGVEYGLELDEEAVNWASEARAAIREVAAWLDENTGGDAAWMLTQEAER